MTPAFVTLLLLVAALVQRTVLACYRAPADDANAANGTPGARPETINTKTPSYVSRLIAPPSPASAGRQRVPVLAKATDLG